MSALSRRQALAGIGIAGTVAAVPVAATAKAQPNRSAWNRAVAVFNAAKAEAEKVSAHYIAVHDAAEAICPHRLEFFSRYDLGAGCSRERNFRAAQMTLVIERTKGRAMLTREEARQASADANRIVDEFEAWSAKRDEVFAETDRLETVSDQAHDRHYKAREALLKLDAPHEGALLFKFAVLGDYLNEVDSEEAKAFATMRRDAFRLLAHGRA